MESILGAQEGGKENERSIKYSNHNYRVDLDNFGNGIWICGHVNDLTLGGVVRST